MTWELWLWRSTSRVWQQYKPNLATIPLPSSSVSSSSPKGHKIWSSSSSPSTTTSKMVILEGGQTMGTEHSRLPPLFHNLICFDQVLTSLMTVVTFLKQTSPIIQNPLIMRSHLLACLLSWTLWYLLPLVMLVIHSIF